MTMYDVDPWNGSNANSGLSWALAWSYLPGNGTAIVAGDEIRYAKTPQQVTTLSTLKSKAAYTGNFPTPTGYSATYTTVPTTFVTGVAGITNAGGGIAIAANTVVPAATRLGYFAMTAWTQSAGYGAAVECQYMRIPSGTAGQYVKYVLCSDALGQVPVLTLTGDFVFETEQYMFTTLRFSSASLINATIGSVAIYSVAGWTQTTAIGYIYVGACCFTPQHTSVDYIPRSSEVLVDDIAPANIDTVTYPVPVTKHINKLIYTSAAWYWTLSDVSKIPLNPTATATTTIKYYKGLPNSRAVHEAVQTFSGTLANPIRIRGGYNTSTGLQDGYTIVGHETQFSYYNSVFLSFTAGGDYLEFERLVGSNTNLVRLKYVTTTLTLNSIKLTDCNIGMGNSGYEGVILVPTTFTTGTYSVSFTRCLMASLLSAITTPTGVAGAMTVTSATATDCWIYSNAWVAGTFKLIGSILIQGTTDYSACIYAGGLNLGIAGSSGSITIDRVGMFGNITFTNYYNVGVASLVDITAKRIRCVAETSGANTFTLALTYFQSTIVDSFATSTLVATALPCTVTCTSFPDAPGQSAYPNATVTLKGNWYSQGLCVLNIKFVYEARIFFDPSFAYTGTHYYPTLTLQECGRINLTAVPLSFIYITVGILPYFPIANDWGLIFTDMHCPIYYSGPTGWVRLYNCLFDFTGSLFSWQAVWNATYNKPANEFGMSLGSVLAYGCTLTGNMGSATATNQYAAMLGVWQGTKGTMVCQFNSSYYTTHTSNSNVRCDPTAVVSIAGTVQNNAHTLQVESAQYHIYSNHGSLMTVDKSVLNSYGRYTASFYGTVPISRLTVTTGMVITISLTACCTNSSNSPLQLLIPPCAAYTTVLSGHAFNRYFVTTNTDYTFNFTITATGAGVIDLYLNCHPNHRYSLKNFAVTVG